MQNCKAVAQYERPRIQLRGVHEGALDMGYVSFVIRIEPIALSSELLRAFGVKHGAGVDDRLCAEGYAGRDVCFDVACDAVHGRAFQSMYEFLEFSCLSEFLEVRFV